MEEDRKEITDQLMFSMIVSKVENELWLRFYLDNYPLMFGVGDKSDIIPPTFLYIYRLDEREMILMRRNITDKDRYVEVSIKLRESILNYINEIDIENKLLDILKDDKKINNGELESIEVNHFIDMWDKLDVQEQGVKVFLDSLLIKSKWDSKKS